MKKKFFYIAIGLVLLMTLISPAIANQSVQAQAGGPGCIDAAGAPIPCPPTDAPSGGGGGGNQNPPSSVATPTNTPFPVANPTDNGVTEASWSGLCDGVDSKCIDDLVDSCKKSGGEVNVIGDGAGGATTVTCTLPAILATPVPGEQLTAPEIPLPEDGFLGSCTNDNLAECAEIFTCEDGLLVIEVDLYASGGTKYDFYCIPHEEIVLLDLPLAFPTDDGSTEENWDGGCVFSGQAELDKCSDALKAACDADGGEYSEFYEDDDSLYAVCENASEGVPPASTPAPEIVVAPTDDGNTEGNEDWEEQCTWNICWGLDLTCWINGGTGAAYDIGDGSYYYSCDMPAEESNSLPPSGWLPWVAVAVGLAIGLLLPAVQKLRAKPDSDSTHLKIKLEDVIISGIKTNEQPKPQTREHVLLNNDDGSTEASDYLMKIEGIKGESKD